MRAGSDCGNQRGTAGNQTDLSGSDSGSCHGSIALVGLGPGGMEHLSSKAVEMLRRSEVIIGYRTYLEFIKTLVEDKEIQGSGMRREVERGRIAVNLALSGKNVAVVSSGDTGVYGMAGLVLEILGDADSDGLVGVEVIPGITAANAAAACLGAPLMHDYATISLSDLLTPWALIKKRVSLAAEGDFVLALYNPKSRQRVRQIEEVREILLRHRLPETPVGIVRNACRNGQQVALSTLELFLGEEIDMLSMVIIGNSQTKVLADRMVTPRGYRL